jgi:ribosome assembly protein 1
LLLEAEHSILVFASGNRALTTPPPFSVYTWRRAEQFISEADAVLAAEDTLSAAAQSHPEREEEEDEEENEDMFSPAKGNVVFGSAGDGWAFRLSDFAAAYAVKLGCNPAALEKALWGDYAFSAKTKRIVRWRPGAAGAPMFVQFALEPLWRVYGAAGGWDHGAALSKLAAALGLGQRVSQRALSSPDKKAAVRALLQAWLPLAAAVLGSVCEGLPSPMAAAGKRAPRLLPPRAAALRGLTPGAEVKAALDAEESAMQACSLDAPPLVYVSKMISIPLSVLPR